MEDMQKRDHALYFIEKGDPDFSPEKNKAIIARSIQKYELMRAKKLKDAKESFSERADAIVTYLKAIDRGGVDTRLDHFFTPNTIRVLRGDDIRAKIHEGLRIVKAKHALKRTT